MDPFSIRPVCSHRFQRSSGRGQSGTPGPWRVWVLHRQRAMETSQQRGDERHSGGRPSSHPHQWRAHDHRERFNEQCRAFLRSSCVGRANALSRHQLLDHPRFLRNQRWQRVSHLPGSCRGFQCGYDCRCAWIRRRTQQLGAGVSSGALRRRRPWRRRGRLFSGNVGGQTHGLATNPLHAGTGGGAGDTSARYQNSAGYGGGVIRIEAADSLVLDGTLSANGGDGGYNYSSGGAGGSINLLCVRFRGGPDSVIRANGGKSSPPTGGGGGGGRIRIARHATRSSFQGTLLTAAGGTGSYENGADGSLVWEDRPLLGGTVIVVR